MTRSVRGVTTSVRLAKELLSIALASASAATFFLPLNLRRAKTYTLFEKKFRWTCFILTSITVVIVHIFIHITISSRHRQTQEIMLIIFRLVSDTILFTFGCGVLMTPICRFAQCFPSLKGFYKTHFFVLDNVLRRKLPFLITIITIVLIMLMSFTPTYLPGDTKRLLEVGMLGDIIDFCGLEGMVLSPKAARGWVLTEYTPKRILSMFPGADNCGTNKISFLDEEEGILIVSPTCPGNGERPIVYLERPERSELSGGPEVLPKVLENSNKWHQMLEKRYGTNEKVHNSMGVQVNRDTTGIILSVELLPSRLNMVLREPRSIEERNIRESWTLKSVWEVPLNESVAYTVYCPSLDYEEYHMFPPLRRNVKSKGNARTLGDGYDGTRKPPANVLMLVLDAVSRQEVLRSLPKFSNWLYQFRKNASSEHIFIEAQGATTLGHSTEANLVPLFTGFFSELEPERGKKDRLNTSLFRLAKKSYGDFFTTSYTTGGCLDLINEIMEDQIFGAGFGESYGEDLDHYTFGPFCHTQYSALEGNFQGANSILKRCIGQRHVHEYVLNYTRSLVNMQMRNRKQWKKSNYSMDDFQHSDGETSSFFHVSHLVEGHEGTHGVLYLIDDALTAFLEDLRIKLRFFDDPSNVLILLSDHGNHMGHYYELTAPGKLERALPFVGMILHPEVFSRIDQLKGRQGGLSRKNMMQRTRRISTHLDLYMTIADLLGVEGMPHHTTKESLVPPSSFFEARTNSFNITKCEDISALPSKESGCYLAWCETQ
ncbi:uncharacterized protein TM35_000131870 [Trypanosoma theileri]|uniref:Uncharacterized protein n=1 Tax=Trypanosoma theileri TaxID=67003 RepID=A0A1X0NXI0_9TRYP|nr:uncharacterized protein TM35_000131870 [Trypanosoma theileri]ORC89183.1 hypothetical protein TM35_000131870 [Trypanosoma theileri]